MTEPTTIHRKGFGLKSQILDDLAAAYHGPLINYMKTHNFKLHVDELHIHLAEEFGFCYGVERAIDYAHQTLQQFPDRKIYLLGEIVHNPFVNNLLAQKGVEIIAGMYQDELDLSFILPQDVVILPAFGVTRTAMEHLQKRNCEIVDTTCGSVISVWKRVEQYAREGFTTVIHGKFPHEETSAICSRITRYPGGKYLVIRNEEEASIVCQAIKGEDVQSLFAQRFTDRMSPNFSLKRDLKKIGVANQTTMLASESLHIAAMLQTAIQTRYGEREVKKRFRNFDTICRATQDRQDALRELLQKQELDLCLIIGGFNSSNTGNLTRVASSSLPTYHVQEVDDLLDAHKIRHKLPDEAEPRISSNWLPEGEVHIGITAGASTPHRKIEMILYRLMALKRISRHNLNQLVQQ